MSPLPVIGGRENRLVELVIVEDNMTQECKVSIKQSGCRLALVADPSSVRGV